MTIPSDQELLDLASRHIAAGRLAEAEAIYRRLLETHPEHPDLMHELGVLAIHTGRPAEARRWLERAVAADPSQPVAWTNLGVALQELGECEAAIAHIEHALRLDPNLAAVFFAAGNVRLRQERFDDAAACYRRMLERHPGHEESHLNLGVALTRKGDTAGAIAAYRAGLQAVPGSSRLWNNLGNLLKAGADAAGAAAAYRRAIELNPGDVFATNNLGDSLKDLGRIDEAIALFRQSIALDPACAEAHSNLIFTLGLHPACDAAAIAAECHRWWIRHGEKVRPQAPPAIADPAPDRRLRVGYVSPDFREHPVARHLLPVVRRHDRREVEVVCYSDAVAADSMTTQLRQCASLWRDTAGWSDDRLAAQVREDRIDLLVDLALHTAGNRLRAFARQPAPVQVSFAGYPGATGVETIAWRLTDRFLEPPDDRVPAAFGRPWRLPDSFWLFDPLEDAAEAGDRPAPAAGSVVFGCLSRFCKVSDPALRAWGELLRRVRASRLLLLCPPGEARAHALARFSALGIEADRVVLTGSLPRAGYLELYRRIDVALDPFPYNGHMTTCDALWMGVPVVSLAGETPVARGGLSLLSTAGLPELVAHTPADYVRTAAELAGDRPRLAALRAGLRARLQASPLMDAARFTRSIEAAFREMWRQACAAGPRRGA